MLAIRLCFVSRRALECVYTRSSASRASSATISLVAIACMRFLSRSIIISPLFATFDLLPFDFVLAGACRTQLLQRGYPERFATSMPLEETPAVFVGLAPSIGLCLDPARSWARVLC